MNKKGIRDSSAFMDSVAIRTRDFFGAITHTHTIYVVLYGPVCRWNDDDDDDDDDDDVHPSILSRF